MLTNELYNKLPIEGKKFYQDVYLNTFTRTGDSILAEQVAVELVKNKLVKQDGMLVAMSESFVKPKLYTFSLDTNTLQVVNNAETGEITIDAILANTQPNVEGDFFTEVELHQLCKQINEEGSTNPDTEHELLKKLESMMPLLRSKYGTDEEAIKQAFKNEMVKGKGMFKSIKSAVKDGKLWIQAKLDKSYKTIVSKLNGLSIEALANNVDGRMTNPKYVGFTFTNTPKLKGARVLSIV